MTNNVSGRKCPNCGSALHYDPENGNLRCDFCDSVFTIEQVDAADRDQAQQVGSMNFTAGNEALQNLKAYVCQSCGAEVVCDPQTVSLVCPYCGSNLDPGERCDCQEERNPQHGSRTDGKQSKYLTVYAGHRKPWKNQLRYNCI